MVGYIQQNETLFALNIWACYRYGFKTPPPKCYLLDSNYQWIQKWSKFKNVWLIWMIKIYDQLKLFMNLKNVIWLFTLKSEVQASAKLWLAQTTGVTSCDFLFSKCEVQEMIKIKLCQIYFWYESGPFRLLKDLCGHFPKEISM